MAKLRDDRTELHEKSNIFLSLSLLFSLFISLSFPPSFFLSLSLFSFLFFLSFLNPAAAICDIAGRGNYVMQVHLHLFRAAIMHADLSKLF